MNRRELLRLTASSLLYTGLAPLAHAGVSSRSRAGRLFFEPEEIPRIRANTKTQALLPLFNEWASQPVQRLSDLLDTYDSSGDMIADFQAAAWTLSQMSFVHLVNPSANRERSLIDAIERIIAYPHWDYFRDAGTEVLGIQRAPFMLVRILFAREVLGDTIGPDLDKRILDAVAKKGCLACYHTVFDMENPDTVKGWDFDERHTKFYDITMERWPVILGANNLRAAPTGALGLGAMALEGHDPRASEWLDLAVTSGKRFLALFSPDGSYFEGLSYLSYSLRTMLPFIQAHRKRIGDVDWVNLVNFNGTLDYIMSMQLGKTPEGEPDIVNFSDARGSVSTGIISLLGDFTGNPLAGYAAKEAGNPRWFFDFLWYQPNAPAQTPRRELLNVRNDLNWIISRSGWAPDDSVLAFKSGGPANHEHADRNHITFKAFGERLLNDHFGAAYDRRNPGWKMRFTEGHNAVLLDGRGHPYVDGIDGTNDSKAFANIIQYQDHGDRIWWTSDASAAYILDNYHAHQVLRTVIFAKPDVMVVLDQVRLRYRAQTVDARFYPDNEDGNAELSVTGNRFVLSRPKARLFGLVASDTGAAPRSSRLDVPAENGDFPCIEVHSPEALSHHILTVLVARHGSSGAQPEINVAREGNTFSVLTEELNATIQTTTREPRVTIQLSN